MDEHETFCFGYMCQVNSVKRKFLEILQALGVSTYYFHYFSIYYALKVFP
jgi:hypothetical protein